MILVIGEWIPFHYLSFQGTGIGRQHMHAKLHAQKSSARNLPERFSLVLTGGRSPKVGSANHHVVGESSTHQVFFPLRSDQLLSRFRINLVMAGLAIWDFSVMFFCRLSANSS